MRILNILIVLFTFAVPPSANATIITFLDPGSGDNRVDSILGLDIEGALYDAKFNYETSFNGLPDPKITFNTSDDAIAALDAIAAFVNTVGDQTGIVTDDVRIPYEILITGNFRYSIGVADSNQNYSDWFAFVIPNGITRRSLVFDGPNAVDALVTFTPSSIAVPEPGSLALFLIALGFGALHLRRRKSAQQQLHRYRFRQP